MLAGIPMAALIFWIVSGALVGGVVASIVTVGRDARLARRVRAGAAMGAAAGLALLLALSDWRIAFIGLAALIGVVLMVLSVIVVSPKRRLTDHLPRRLRGQIGQAGVREEDTRLSGWPEGLPRGVYWVSPERLLAGPYPYMMLDRVLTLGVTHFVNLTQPRELTPYDGVLPPNVSHERHPIPDLGVPSRGQMLATLDAIDGALAAGKTVYVHCWGGIGRTGTVIGCWLVRHGMPGPAALNELVRLRAGFADSPETDEQHAFVRGWNET